METPKEVANRINNLHAEEGLEMTLEKIGDETYESIDGLTTKQMRRALKATVEYLYKRKISVDEKSLSDREKLLLGSIGALVEMGFAYQQYVFKQIEQEKLAESNEGESNE